MMNKQIEFFSTQMKIAVIKMAEEWLSMQKPLSEPEAMVLKSTLAYKNAVDDSLKMEVTKWKTKTKNF